MSYDWLGRWQKNDITFHLDTINPLLEQYWPTLNIPKGTNVLVPLCGKSLDMLWLVKQGYHVIGAELSSIACENFFTENNLPFKTEKTKEFTRFYNDHIELYCGDFFALSKDMLPPITAVYDRAALMALPKDMRPTYAKQTQNLLAPHSKILLIVIETANDIKGPPYSVAASEIKKIYNQLTVKELAHPVKILPPHWRTKGHKDQETFEVVYILK